MNSSKESKLKQIKISLCDRMEITRNFDEVVLDALEDEEIEAEIGDVGVFSEKILELIMEIESVSSLHKSKSQSGSGSLTPRFNGGKRWWSKQARQTAATKFDKFFQDPSQQLTFWDSFRSAVHENPELHNIQKFNYLKGLLKGSAAATITGLPFNGHQLQCSDRASNESVRKQASSHKQPHGCTSQTALLRNHSRHSEITANL